MISPVVSAIVTNITKVMLAIAAMLNVGKPYLKGVVTPSQAAFPTLEKSVIPRGIATSVPTIRPMRMAILLTKPLKKR